VYVPLNGIEGEKVGISAEDGKVVERGAMMLKWFHH